MQFDKKIKLDQPEHIVAQWLATYTREDHPGLISAHERKNAHRICDALRAAGWRIIRQ
jgi:superfamily II DNA helicase RecQ